MARGKVHAASASMIHMLVGVMSPKDAAAGGRGAADRSSGEGGCHNAEEPCLVFFVRQPKTHPGTVRQ